MPNNLPYSNCTDLDLFPLNTTHFRVVLGCRDTKRISTRTFLFATIRINSQDLIDWDTLPSSQFSYTAVLDSKIILKQELVIRSVSTSANSYIELWSWTDSYK